MHCYNTFSHNRKTAFIAGICCLLSSVSATNAHAWGVWGHNHINKGAIMALPQEMGMFFYNHADFITEESTIPDIRKYTMKDKEEGPRHYIDLEWYHYTSSANMPKTLAEVIMKYGKDSTDKYGVLPWYMQEMMDKLTTAFKNKRRPEILLIAADLGHYIGDAHMPLHTTINHDGQFTGQRGIHAFWESQLPEIFGKQYNLFTTATYIDKIEQATWNIIDSSYSLIERLLETERNLRKDNPEDKQYVMDAEGKALKNKYNQPVHSYEYARGYHEMLNGMVEKQMRLAVKNTASFWYTAWVNAGKPDLSDLDPESAAERNKDAYKEDLKAWKKGKVKGTGSDKEFPEEKK